jgi:DNA-binding XRE family transcriptional regulator
VGTIVFDDTFDMLEFGELVATSVQAMRERLGVTVADLAKESGIPCPRIEAIEDGDTTTYAERHEIAVTIAWLLNRD